jgi:hypothetical protein
MSRYTETEAVDSDASDDNDIGDFGVDMYNMIDDSLSDSDADSVSAVPTEDHFARNRAIRLGASDVSCNRDLDSPPTPPRLLVPSPPPSPLSFVANSATNTVRARTTIFDLMPADPSSITIAELKPLLRLLHLPCSGKKIHLVPYFTNPYSSYFSQYSSTLSFFSLSLFRFRVCVLH